MINWQFYVGQKIWSFFDGEWYRAVVLEQYPAHSGTVEQYWIQYTPPVRRIERMVSYPNGMRGSEKKPTEDLRRRYY